ncbi:MAG: DUF1302 family protein [Opitutaceae bacterium]
MTFIRALMSLGATFLILSPVTGVEFSFESEDEPIESSAKSSEFIFESEAEDAWFFSGKISITLEYFGQESPKDPERDALLGGYLLLNKAGQWNEAVEYVVTPKFYAHSADLVGDQVELLETDPLRPVATFEEAYVALYKGNLEFTVGKQIVSWGVGDAIKPNDVINPGDYLSVSDSFKIGVPALSAYHFGELFNVNLVLVPFFTPARLPGLDNRWSTDSTQTSADFQTAFGIPPTFVDDGDVLPANQFRNMQGGIQFSSSSLVEGWDLALYYYRGFQSTGVINQRIAPPELGILIVYPEFSHYGASFSTTWNQFEFHGEVVFHDTKNSLLDDDFLSYMGGLNYTIDDNLPIWVESVSLVLEYTGETIIKDRSPGGSISQSGFGRAFTNSIFAQLEFKVSEDTQFEIGGALNIDTEDYVIGTSLTHKLTDALEFKVGIDVFGGDDDTFYGGWNENDRIYTSATYFF